jgi:hypothetical protein
MNQYQTRSSINGIEFTNSLQEATRMVDNDKTIWKISFSQNDENYRFIIQRPTDENYIHPLIHKYLESLYPNYSNYRKNTIFFINESMDLLCEFVIFISDLQKQNSYSEYELYKKIFEKYFISQNIIDYVLNKASKNQPINQDSELFQTVREMLIIKEIYSQEQILEKFIKN